MQDTLTQTPISSEQIISLEDALALVQEQEKKRKQQLQDLAGQVESKFLQDMNHRTRKEREWAIAEQLILGSTFRFFGRENNTDQPFTNGPMSDTQGLGKGLGDDPPGHNIVRPKLKIAKAQLEMLQFGAGTDKNFTVRAKEEAEDYATLQNQPAYHNDGQTPVTNEQGEPMTIGQLVNLVNAKEASAAKQMDEEIFSQLQHCKYGQKIRDGFDDELLYGTAVYRGPVNNVKCNKNRRSMQTSDGKTVWITSYSETPSPDFDIIKPWFFYPDHRALTIDEAEHATVVWLHTAKTLRNLTKREGFFKDEITELLKAKPISSYYQGFKIRSADYGNDYLKDKYVVLEWHGTVGIDDLKNLNIEPPYENPLDVYRAEIWVCQGRVIFASLEMLEADDELPFAVSVWEKDPSNFFGFGAVLLRDPQRVVDKLVKMILDNAGLIALPQAVVNKEMCKPIDGKPELTPGKIWYTEYPNGKAGDFIQFFEVPEQLDKLTGVLNLFKDFGNEESLIPLIQGGLADPQIADAGATGMAMIMQASTSVLSSKAREWDDCITKKIVSWFYEWNMQYSQKEEIKGDYEVDVQTSTSYLNKVMGQRDLERLCLEFAQNQELQDLLIPDELYRARLSSMNVPYDLIVRSQEEVDKIRAEKAKNAKPDPEDIKAQATLISAQAKEKDAENTATQIQFDAQQGFEEAKMNHDEKMAQYQVRMQEQEARRIESENQVRLQVMEMQSRDQQHLQKTILDANKHVDSMKNDKFKTGLSAVQTQQKIDLEKQKVEATKEELKLKRQGKTGI